MDPTLLTIARSFAAKVKVNFDTPVRAQPEDQLKSPVVELIEGSGTLFARNVEARTEAQVQGLGARPDIGVAVDRLLSGFVELKAPGKGARPERFTGADREQWVKFRRRSDVDDQERLRTPMLDPDRMARLSSLPLGYRVERPSASSRGATGSPLRLTA